MAKSYRDLRLMTLFSAPLRTAAFEGTNHLVVPTVALVEGVVFAGGADGPELVPYELLQKMPTQWNGRPAVWDHPVVDGQRMSANDPRVLERYAIGTVFNARTDDEARALVLESWMDPRRYEGLSEGKAVVRRAQAQQPIEVSVGVLIVARKEEGVFKGKRYGAVWEEITSDHVAYLPEGTLGACSNEMGCGAPRRAAAVYLASANGPMLFSGSEEPMADRTGFDWKATLSRILKVRGAAEGDQVSAADIRKALDSALLATEPGFLGVGEDGLFLEDKQVVYAVSTTADGPAQFFRRTFELGEAGVVTLGKDRAEVTPVTRFEEVGKGGDRAATSSTTSKRTACGCGGGAGADQPAAASDSNNNGGRDMKTIKERAAAIVASSKTPFKSTDIAYLEGLSEARLTEIEATIPAETAVIPPTPGLTIESVTKLVTDAVAAAFTADRAASAAKTDEQRIAELPANVRALVEKDNAEKTARRTVLSAALKTKGSKLDDAALAAMPLEQLEEVARMCGIAAPQPVAANYALSAGNGSGSDDQKIPAPRSLSDAFKEKRTGTK